MIGGLNHVSTGSTYPAHAAEWSDPGIDAAYDDVWQMLMNGLRVPKSPKRPKRCCGLKSSIKNKAPPVSLTIVVRHCETGGGGLQDRRRFEDLAERVSSSPVWFSAGLM